MSSSWIIEAPTISRIIYDSLAAVLGEVDRLLVCELNTEALCYNLEQSEG